MHSEKTYVSDEGAPVTHRDQFFKEDGTFFVKNEVFQAIVYVYDLSSATEGTPIHTDVAVLDDVWFDTPQKGSDWTVDKVGYNWKYTFPGAWFAAGGKTFQCKVVAEVESGSPLEAMAPVTRTFNVKVRGTTRG